MTSKNEDEGGKEEKRYDKNALEWSVFAVSLLLVGSVLAFLGRETLLGATRPARLEVTLGEPVKAQESVMVPVTVRNRGDATAAGVEIEVKRRNSDESGNFSLPYVPRQSSRNGWVVFDAPLDKKDLKAQILGYEEP